MDTQNTLTSPETSTQNCEGMFAKPQQEHKWLQKLVGEWSFESECAVEPGQPVQKFRGSERVKNVGDLWIVGEGEGEMPGGGTSTMMITLGFDPKRNQFVGTWLGSMMTHLWKYEGQLDASGKILTLDSEGPCFDNPDKLARYQDVIEMKSDDHRILTARTLGDDGKWTRFMTANYRRVK